MSTKTKAYSYLRISTDQQKVGDGVRRQLEASKAYALRHDYELVEELSDIGVSAFKGKNATEGALGTFIAALDEGRVEAGSILIVENLDRLSRNTVLDAFAQFTNILNKGVGIVTLTDGQHYTAESVNQNVGQLFLSLGGMLRAHEESVIKSKRVGAAWARKRENLGDKVLTKVVPAWLQVSEDGKSIVIDEPKAEIVRHIFKLSIDGMGGRAIRQHLNANLAEFPNIANPGKSWQSGYLHKILTNPAVYGQFQPHQFVDGKRVPHGDPVEDYYPAIISKEIFDFVQAVRNDRSEHGKGRKGETVTSIFSGLLYCGFCGGKVSARRRYEKNGGSIPYLRCVNALDKNECPCGGWQYDDFEASFIKFVREIKFSDVFAGDDGSQTRKLEVQRASVAQSVAEKEKAIAALTKNFEAGDLPEALRVGIIQRATTLETELSVARQLLASLDLELAKLATTDVAQDQQDFLTKYDSITKTKDQTKLREVRFALAALLRRRIDRITVYNHFPLDPHDADEFISDKFRAEIMQRQRFKYDGLETYMSKPANLRKYVESERNYSVRFKSGVVRIVHPYEGMTYNSVSERLAALKRGA